MFRVCKFAFLDNAGKVKFLTALRTPPALLLIAVLLGLAAANSPVARILQSFFAVSQQFCFPPACFALSVPEVAQLVGVSAFFLLVGLELKREFIGGALKPARNAVAPLLAAILGVALPALWYLAVNYGLPSAAGWPIPTATDVTFALAVYVSFGRNLPGAARTFLLAFAVMDDVIAVLIIGVLFTGDRIGFPFGFLPVVIPVTIYFLLQQLRLKGLLGKFAAVVAGLSLIIALVFLALAGIEPALLAVAVGLLTPKDLIAKLEARLTPVVSYALLPLFAFFAAFVALPAVTALSWPVFIGIVARPIWKFVGVFVGGLIGSKFADGPMRLSVNALWRVAALGGIGFTVSLLVAQLAFGRGKPAELGTAVLATLVASVISVVAGAFALARGHRTQTADRA